MGQKIKVLAIKSDDLSSVLRTLKAEEKLTQVVF